MLKKLYIYLYNSSLPTQIAAGIILRLLWIAISPFEPISDSYIYHQFAQQIASGHGYAWPDGSPTAYWAVGPSAIYGFFYFLIGSPAYAVAIANIIFFSLLCIAVRNASCKWFGPDTCGLSGWIVVCWPTLIMLSNIPNSETLYMPLFVGSIAILDPVSPQRKPLNLFLGGIASALAALVRPTAIILPVFLGGIAFLSPRSRWRNLAWYAIVTLVMTAVISPWTARNYLAFDSLVPISLNFGANFWMGNNPESSGRYMPLPKDVLKGLEEVDRDKKLRSLTFSYIKDKPIDFIARTAKKFFLQYKSMTIGVEWSGIEKTKFGQLPLMTTTIKIISSGYWLMFLVCWLTGGVLLWKRIGLAKMAVHPTVILAIGYSVIQAIIVIQDRYVLSWAGAMIPLTAHGLCWWRHQVIYLLDGPLIKPPDLPSKS